MRQSFPFRSLGIDSDDKNATKDKLFTLESKSTMIVVANRDCIVFFPYGLSWGHFLSIEYSFKIIHSFACFVMYAEGSLQMYKLEEKFDTLRIKMKA